MDESGAPGAGEAADGVQHSAMYEAARLKALAAHAAGQTTQRPSWEAFRAAQKSGVGATSEAEQQRYRAELAKAREEVSGDAPRCRAPHAPTARVYARRLIRMCAACVCAFVRVCVGMACSA